MKKTMAMATAALLCLYVNADDLTVPSGTTHSVSSNEEYGTVTLEGGTVSLNPAQLKCKTVNATANSTIRFNGGKLAAASPWDAYWFQPSSGSTLTLESVDGKDIYLDVGYQRHYFSTGAGTVATTGSGDIVVDSLLDGNGNRMYLTFTANNVTWGHSGNLRAVGKGGLRLAKTSQNANSLPSGAATGGIKLEGSTELVINNSAESLVNSIEGPVRAEGSAWLKFGHNKSGTFKDAPNVGGTCTVEKYGVGTTLTLDNTGFYKLDVKNGTVVATGGATTIKDLSMNADTTLNVIDTTFAATNSAALKGATTAVAVGASGVFDAVGSSDASFLLDSAGAVVKRGAGTWNVYPSQAFSGRLQVSGGTLKFRYKEQQSCANDQWWRLSITKQYMYNSIGVSVAEIGLFVNGSRVNASLTKTEEDVRSMPYGTAKITTSNFSTGNVAALFDSAASTLWGWNQADATGKPTISGNNPLTVVMRLPSAHVGKVVTAVDLSDDEYYNEPAQNFTLESSADGVNWTFRASRQDMSRGKWPNWYGGSSHFAIADATREVDGTGHGGYGLSSGTVVRVDSGATLDMSLVKTSENVVSALEFDATVGGGTITDCAFAEQGTLNVVNATRGDLKTLALPLTVVRATGAANLANWKVVLNGVELRGWELRFANDNTVTFVPPGAILVVF